MTLEEVDQLLVKLQEEEAEYERKYDPYNNPVSREVERVTTLREFVECGVPFEYYGDHIVLFDKYIITLRKRRWRVDGKNTWYHFKNAEDLLTRYLLKDEIWAVTS